MSKKTQKSVELPEADKQRMARLYEEIQGRLREMSLIVARTLDQKMTARTTVMFRPSEADTAAENDRPVAREHVEVICTQTSEGHWECGCYDYDTGTCGPC